jgi:crossover junction endodeoxyribonuclease RusA
LSLNHRRHWSRDHAERVQLMTAVHWLLKDAKTPALDFAHVWLEWTPAVSRRRDTDNLEPRRKACVDAIVRAGLLPDDTPEFVARPENVIHRPKPAALLDPHRRLVLVIADHDPRGLLDQVAARRGDSDFMTRLATRVAEDRPILDRLATGHPS